MKTTEIAREDWGEFFDRVSRSLRGKQIDIEVDGLDIGTQIEASKLSLNGLSYDHKDDVFVITTEVIEHLIHEPQQIFVSGDEDGFDSLEITTGDGGKQIVSFSEPLALPGPPGGPA